MAIAVLFARRDSQYKKISGLDVWDEDRNARFYTGEGAVIAHPPCRGWGRLRAFSKAKTEELELALLAVQIVRKNGGVLEHPVGSRLWGDMGLPGIGVVGLPKPGVVDRYGGFTLPISQKWWGHRAEKATFLYICGVGVGDVPRMPFVIGESEAVMGSKSKRRKEITKAEREHTPVELIDWLILLCKRIEVNKKCQLHCGFGAA